RPSRLDDARLDPARGAHQGRSRGRPPAPLGRCRGGEGPDRHPRPKSRLTAMSNYRIMVADELSPEVIEILRSADAVVVQKDMQVVAYDPVLQKAPPGIRLVTFDECLEQADFLTIHVPLLDSTKHLIDAKAFARLKRGARLVHAARGGIVDEAALCDALDSGH